LRNELIVFDERANKLRLSFEFCRKTIREICNLAPKLCLSNAAATEALHSTKCERGYFFPTSGREPCYWRPSFLQILKYSHERFYLN